jgi:hypothetical protein
VPPSSIAGRPCTHGRRRGSRHPSRPRRLYRQRGTRRLPLCTAAALPLPRRCRARARPATHISICSGPRLGLRGRSPRLVRSLALTPDLQGRRRPEAGAPVAPAAVGRQGAGQQEVGQQEWQHPQRSQLEWHRSPELFPQQPQRPRPLPSSPSVPPPQLLPPPPSLSTRQSSAHSAGAAWPRSEGALPGRRAGRCGCGSPPGTERAR